MKLPIAFCIFVHSKISTWIRHTPKNTYPWMAKATLPSDQLLDPETSGIAFPSGAGQTSVSRSLSLISAFGEGWTLSFSGHPSIKKSCPFTRTSPGNSNLTLTLSCMGTNRSSWPKGSWIMTVPTHAPFWIMAP